MVTVTSRPPTQKGISALLKRAGFRESERQIGGFSSGFVTEKVRTREGAVRVRHRFWSIGGGDGGPWVAKYAKVIAAAGWHVQTGESELIVTARPGDRRETDPMNDAEPYIAAVADACQAAGLIVGDYTSDDIDPRDGVISIVLRPDVDPDEDYSDVRTLGWDEEKGWLFGQPKDPHGELTGILYFGGGPLPAPADVAETARRIIAAEISDDERHTMIRPTRWRDQEDDDGFEEQLAAYRDAATAAGGA